VRKSDRTRAVPIQFQILESDHVPLAKNEQLSNGNRIIAGIEFNPNGERVAYWVLPNHPGEDSAGASSDAVRVDAGDIIHHFRPKRPGQVRGEPDTVRSLLKARDFDDYDDAELLRKKTRAPFTGFLTRAEFTEDDYVYDPFTGKSLDGSDLPPELDMQAGNILQGLPGEKLDLFSGDDTGAGYADFMRQQLLAIAAGISLPYELLTGDWKNVNDRLVRAIQNEFRRQIEMDQELGTSQCYWRMWGWWMDGAVMAGTLRAPGYAGDPESFRAAEWTPDPWPYINPDTDISAAQKEIDAGLASRDQHIVRRGRDPSDVDREQAEGEKRRREFRVQAGLPPDPPAQKSGSAPPAPPKPDPNQTTGDQ
jgi:lambda family phage portal protein